MINLETRIDKAELMDDLSLPFEEFKETLSGIETINHLSWAYLPTIKAIEKFYEKYHQTKNIPLRILDIGSGYGDHLRAIYYWGKRNNIKLELTGLDLNPWSAQAASEANADVLKMQFISTNIFEFKPIQKYDICINALLTHHLKDNEIVDLLKWMTLNSNYGWFINDLHRHPLPYYFIKYFTRIFAFNKLVRNDAPLSVARSFKLRDWKHYCEVAGLNPSQFKVSWQAPFRYCVSYNQ